MIACIGALCAVLLALGGGLVALDEVGIGIGCISLGALGGGTVFAALQASLKAHDGIEVRDGLNLTQLWLFLNNRVELTGDTKLFIGDQGLNPAGAVFTCVLDGQRVVVIERKAEVTETAEQLF